MTLVMVIILAVVQGVTEFLPISSSGHLVVLSAILTGAKMSTEIDSTDVNIVLHFGTLVSILVFYRRRILRLLTRDRNTLWMLVLGTLPVATVGLMIKKLFPTILTNPLLAGILLVVNSLVLFWAARRVGGDRRCEGLTIWPVLAIGIAQAFAILPGISRSGATISAGLAAGLRREDAATFSFLLAIPAIFGATLLQFLDVLGGEPLSTRWDYLLIGAVLSFGIGLASIWILLRVLERAQLRYFALWCLLAGGYIVGWQFQLWPWYQS